MPLSANKRLIFEMLESFASQRRAVEQKLFLAIRNFPKPLNGGFLFVSKGWKFRSFRGSEEQFKILAIIGCRSLGRPAVSRTPPQPETLRVRQDKQSRAHPTGGLR